MTIYNLFQTGASCILYGLLVTATLMAIMYFFLKEYNKNIVRTIPFFITGVVLAVLLTIQSSLLIGAVKAKGMVEAQWKSTGDVFFCFIVFCIFAL